MIRLIILITLSVIALCSPMSLRAQSSNSEMFEGEVVEVFEENRINGLGEEYLFQSLKTKVYKGSLAGSIIEIVNDTISITSAPKYKVGDKVVIMYTKDIEGGDLLYITDYVRRDGLLLIFAIFTFLAVLVGGVWGITSLVGMAYSFLILFKVVLPLIMDGRNALMAAVIGSILIIPVTFSLSHGLKMKTLIAGVGTVITLIFIGVVAAFSIDTAKLTGFSSEEANFLQVQLGQIVNVKGLLLAGIIISSLGILDDITISQASIVAELKKANAKYDMGRLFSQGMVVGRDHIASLINTLVLVYAGASLPLLLLFINNPSPFSEVVNIEMIADEIVRTLVGSMGLILAVPITTFLAAFYYKDKINNGQK